MLKHTIFALLSCSFVVAQFPVPKGDGTNGSGKYPAYYSTEPSLKGFTIYAPKTVPPEKLPILLWGNGMCSDQGLGFRNFLTEFASHGYFIIANGEPEGKGQSPDTKMSKSLDWAEKNAGTGKYAHIDKTRIGAAGQSCGGIQAYKISVDKRITLTGMFDSGNLFGNFKLSSLHAPVGYFLGGTSDMAYKNGLNDFKALAENIPAILVNNPKGGHMQSFMDKQGGLVAKAGVAWFDWMMKNSTEGKEFLLGKGSSIAKAGWQVQTRHLS